MRAIDWLPGAVIAERYRLVRRVGEGGMGVIWAADDLVTGRRTALKRIKDTVDDPAARRRFLHEARAASVVRHPNVVEIFDVLELEAGPPVLAMELLDGESLRDVLVRDRTLSVPALADVLVPVIAAVGAAHALGVVHRDLKPENIFLARTAGARVVKVLDFGIAKLTALDGEAMRSAGLTTTAVLGTPAYMAPEQVFGERDIDHRADIWALGVVIYECLAGVRPTDGDNVGQVLKHVVARPFVPLAQQVDGLPDGVARLVERMLVRERSHRVADLHDALAVLEPFASAPGVPFDAPAAHFARADDAAIADTLPGDRGPRAADVRPPARDPVVNPPPARWRAIALGLGLAAALTLIGLRLVRARRSPPDPIPAASPLTDPASKLACPILDASGVNGPAGWLGAAAAATVCERARVILGGRPERTLVPAELLELPRRLVDDFPADPYAAPDARERSLRAARRDAAAYIGGTVVQQPQGFEITLELHAGDGKLLDSSRGSARGLLGAVRAAMAPLVERGALPRARELDGRIAAWSRTRDVEAALGVLDLTLARAQNAGDLEDECARVAPVLDRVRDLGPMMRWECAYTLGRPAPAVEPLTADDTPEAAATRIRVRNLVRGDHGPGDIDQIHRQLEAAPPGWGKSLLAATESCLLQDADPGTAYQRALEAVWLEPKNPDGQECNPWEQLMTMVQDTTSAGPARRAMQAWAPWNDNAWLMEGLAAATPETALAPLRRAYALAPFDTQVADTLADRLLAAGRPVEAEGIASALGHGQAPVQIIESQLIRIRLLASEARFGEALAAAHAALDHAGSDAGWARAERFQLAWHALEIAAIIGRGSELAEQLVQQFLEPEPAVLDSSDIQVPARIAAVCTAAPAEVARQCFARLAALRGQVAGKITPETDRLLRGAERFAAHDLPHAADAWRPLLDQGHELVRVLPDAMAAAFDEVGDSELAQRVDDAVMGRAAEFHGATLGDVRSARRARRSAPARAQALARKVIDAWQTADPVPPSVGELRALLAK